jgi:hypothetical protein
MRRTARLHHENNVWSEKVLVFLAEFVHLPHQTINIFNSLSVCLSRRAEASAGREEVRNRQGREEEKEGREIEGGREVFFYCLIVT